MRGGAAVILLGCLLFGCSVVGTRIEPALAPAANIGNSVTCQNSCGDEWDRSQLWLARHSKWKIQTSSNVLLQTYNPVDYDPSYGFTVMKEPRGGGAYTIRLALICGNLLGCDPNPLQVSKAFYYYVLTGTDLLEGQSYLGAIR